MNDFEVNRYAFLYCDSEYFEWFKAKARGELTDDHLRRVLQWKLGKRAKHHINRTIRTVWNRRTNRIIGTRINELFRPVTAAFA